MKVVRARLFSATYIPYSGKFLKGFIFENFENGQALLKIFFRNC